MFGIGYSTKLYTSFVMFSCFVHLYVSLIMLVVGCWLGRMCKVIKGVRARSARQILSVICKINVFLNTVVRWDLDMTLHSELPRAPQLASPLLDTPYSRRVKVFLELPFSAIAMTIIVKFLTWLSMQSKQSSQQLAWWLLVFFSLLQLGKLARN